MNKQRLASVIVCVALLAGPAWAQQARKGPPGGKPAKIDPVLNHVPAGAMGYLVMSNVAASMGGVDRVLTNIGLGDLAAIGTLNLVVAQARLGRAFDPNGGLAVVMLDAKQFGVDLRKFFADRGAPAGKKKPLDGVKLPWAVFLPANSIEGLFPTHEQEPSGKYTTVHLTVGPVVAAQHGPYVVVSPLAKVLDAVAKAEKKAAGELTEKEAKAIAESDLAVRLNMKLAGPVLMEIADNPQGMGPVGFILPGPVGSGLTARQKGAAGSATVAHKAAVRQALAQVESMIRTLDVKETGLLVQDLVTFAADSPLGAIFKGYTRASAAGLKGLPDLPCLLAAANVAPGGIPPAVIKDHLPKMIDKMFEDPKLAKAPPAAKAKLRQLSTDMISQIESVRLVVGTPPGDGLLGMVMVIRCADARKLKGILGEIIPVKDNILEAVAAPQAKAKRLRLTYVKNDMKLGSVSADAVIISCPELEADKPAFAKVQQLLGDEKLRVLAAAVDDKTLVITLGGARGLLAEAIKAAKNPAGGLAANKDIAEAMALLKKHSPPKGTMAIVAIDSRLLELLQTPGKHLPTDQAVALLCEALKKLKTPPQGPATTAPGAAKTQPAPAAGPGKLIVAALAADGSAAHVLAHIPNEVLAKFVQKAITSIMKAKAGKAAPKGELTPDSL